MDNNKFYCLIGRDRKDVEQIQLSPDTARLFAEDLHTLNYTNFLQKVRDIFLNIKQGSHYSEHRADDLPKSFFYCPLPISSGAARDVAAVWGECGIYRGGREFRYAHYYIENYSKLDAHTLICKLFTSVFCADEEITDILSRGTDHPTDMRRVISFDSDYVKEISDRCRQLVSAVAEKLCDGKTVIIKLAEGNDFNRDAKDILAQIMSMLPGDFRRQVGFVTYLQTEQIRRFADQSNNIRLIVVDSDVNLSEFENATQFAIVNYDRDYAGDIACREDFEAWSRIDFEDREQQIAQFSKLRSGQISSTRDILPKMIEVYREAEDFASDFSETEVRTCRSPEELAGYFNEFDICKIVPLARQRFVREIPRMLPDGVTLESMLIEALRCGDEKRRKAAKFCIFNFVKDASKLIDPIGESLDKANAAGAERQRIADDSKLEEFRTQTEKLNADLAGLNTSFNERGERIKELEDIKKQLGDKVDELSEQIGELEKRLDKSKADYDAMNSELGKLNGQLESTKAKLLDAESRYSEATDRNNELSKSIGSLKAEYEKKLDEISELKGNIGNLNAELDSARGDIEKLSTEKTALEARLDEAQTELEKKTSALQSSESDRSKLQADILVKDADIADKKALIAEYDAKLKDYMSKLDDLSAKLSESEKNLDSINRELINEKLRATEAESKSKAALEEAENIRRKALEQVETLQREKSADAQTISSLQAQIAGFERDKNASESADIRDYELMRIIKERLDIKLIAGSAILLALAIGFAIGALIL